MLSKLDKINYIKTVVKEFGSFNTDNIELDIHSVLCIESDKDTFKVLKSFTEHRVEISTRNFHSATDEEISSEFISYEDFAEHIIETIFNYAQLWEDVGMGIKR